MRRNWREVSGTGTLQIKAPKTYLNQRYCVSINDVGFRQALGACPEPGEDLIRNLPGINLDR